MARVSGSEPLLTDSPTAHTNGLNDGTPCQGITEPRALDSHIPETSKIGSDVLIHFSVYSLILLFQTLAWSLSSFESELFIRKCLFGLNQPSDVWLYLFVMYPSSCCLQSAWSHIIFSLLVFQASNSATPAFFCLSLSLPPPTLPHPFSLNLSAADWDQRSLEHGPWQCGVTITGPVSLDSNNLRHQQAHHRQLQPPSPMLTDSLQPLLTECSMVFVRSSTPSLLNKGEVSQMDPDRSPAPNS